MSLSDEEDANHPQEPGKLEHLFHNLSDSEYLALMVYFVDHA